MIDLPSFALTVGRSFAILLPCGSMFFILTGVTTFAQHVVNLQSISMLMFVREPGGGLQSIRCCGVCSQTITWMLMGRTS